MFELQTAYPPWTCPFCGQVSCLILPPSLPMQRHWHTVCLDFKRQCPPLTALSYDELLDLLRMELELREK